jgi:HPt (histidine-containing phosphotransfer) domain-containing protein
MSSPAHHFALPQEGEAPLIDHRVMSDWCDDLDKADVCGLLARVPDETRKCIADVRLALQGGNLAMAKRAAHRLKGMASNLGAARLASVARSVELGCPTIAEADRQVAVLEATMTETLEALEAHVQTLG